MATPAPVLTGSLDSAGHPTIKINVYGLSEQFQKEFEAMIDTGFTGFLMMPLTESFPLALTLYGTSSWTLAGGTLQPKLLAFGTVLLEGVHTHGVILLEPNASRPLLGMEFLRESNKALVVSKAGCFLIDEGYMNALAQQHAQQTQQPTAVPANKPPQNQP